MDDGVNWDDRSRPPRENAICIEPALVYATWATTAGSDQATELLLWHWCDRSVWLAKPEARPEYCTPKWQPAGGSGHDLIAREPLHVEPSVYWPGCCGLHGYVRDGKWVPA